MNAGEKERQDEGGEEKEGSKIEGKGKRRKEKK